MISRFQLSYQSLGSKSISVQTESIYTQVKLCTGLFIIIGTTFGGCTEPQSDLTKNLFNDYMKIIIKISYGY